MKKYLVKFRQYLQWRDSWIFVGLLLATAAVYANLMAPDNWLSYGKTVFLLLLSYSPVILFAHFKEEIKNRFERGFKFFWITVFLIYPIVIQLLLTSATVHFHWEPCVIQFFPALTFLLPILEILLFINRMLQGNYKNRWRFNRIKIKHSFFISLGMLSGLLGLIFINSDAAPISSSFYYRLFHWFTSSIQCAIPLLILAFFVWINYKLLVPEIYKIRGFFIYLLSAAAVVVLLFPITSQIINWLPLFVHHPALLYEDGQHIFAEINAFIPLLTLIGTVPIIVSLQWQNQHQRIQELEKENTEAELKFLKQQINPHFFFNTLNNLYSLALEKSDKNPEAIMKLSELMRYVIYRGSEKKVAISEEINYLKDYISLQRIRFQKKFEVVFGVQIPEEQWMISPLLLTEPIENAFKHGIAPAEGNSFLHIHIEVTNDELVFDCKNSFEALGNRPQGIGLKNLRRRLALLHPDCHELHTLTGKNSFTLQLRIWKN